MVLTEQVPNGIFQKITIVVAEKDPEQSKAGHQLCSGSAVGPVSLAGGLVTSSWLGVDKSDIWIKIMP